MIERPGTSTVETREEKLTWLWALVPDAQRAFLKWPGMRVAVCLAQAALESGWGKKPIGKGNLWGIKALKWVPSRILVDTHEWVDGKLVKSKQEFADFPSIYDGMLCYGRLVTNSPSYRLAREACDLEEYTSQLCKVWATDPFYRKKVWTLIQYAGLEGIQDRVYGKEWYRTHNIDFEKDGMVR